VLAFITACGQATQKKCQPGAASVGRPACGSLRGSAQKSRTCLGMRMPIPAEKAWPEMPGADRSWFGWQGRCRFKCPGAGRKANRGAPTCSRDSVLSVSAGGVAGGEACVHRGLRFVAVFLPPGSGAGAEPAAPARADAAPARFRARLGAARGLPARARVRAPGARDLARSGRGAGARAPGASLSFLSKGRAGYGASGTGREQSQRRQERAARRGSALPWGFRPQAFVALRTPGWPGELSLL